AVQRPAGAAFSTEGVRINPSWSWRQMFRSTVSSAPGSRASSGQTEAAMAHVGPEGCEETNAYRWIFVDFGENESEAGAAMQAAGIRNQMALVKPQCDRETVSDD